MASGKTSRHRVKQASKQAAGFANQGTQETREKETNNRPCTYKTIVSCTYMQPQQFRFKDVNHGFKRRCTQEQHSVLDKTGFTLQAPAAVTN